MRTIVTKGIVLGRTNFGEADRILTVLTPDQGKLRLMAKGVRKVKSKLAGGVELLSVSDISYIPGKKEIGTLVSSRLIEHFGEIVKDIDRVQAAYRYLKIVDDCTTDDSEEEYFILLRGVLDAANDHNIDLHICDVWLKVKLLVLMGVEPNLATDISGNKLVAGKYSFDFDNMVFAQSPQGTFATDHIKLLRFIKDSSLRKVSKVNNVLQLSADLEKLINTLFAQSLNT